MSAQNQVIKLLLAFLFSLSIVGVAGWSLFNLFTNSDLKEEAELPSTRAIILSDQDSIIFAEVPEVPTGLFNYGGSTTWAPVRDIVDSKIQAAIPSFQLRYTDSLTEPPGSSTGIRMLVAGQLSFSQSSRPLKAEDYEKAKANGFNLKEVPVGLEALAIAVHPDLPVAGITVKQLQDIYTGKITNWSEVGGPSLPIIAYSRYPNTGGTVDFFLQDVLGSVPLASNVEFVYNTTLGLRKVGENPGGIYYASAPEVVPQCTVKGLPIGKESGKFVPPYQEPLVTSAQCPKERNQLNMTAFKAGEYPITRRMFVIIKENGELDEQAGNAYANLLLSDQGQQLLLEAGFVPIGLR
ncbi:PstS family phosphate ABC transporter substrate-binding protein [Gloeocapsa sp. PCC 73106]|uniref:PstS family phosphate ABC transporter substrate-binding protein n=1 Tax=Gloeocapsa sp. PCC 73106 TaxID=102232 RepID=UPI0002ABD630|nr:PstS family phosphate ABC transporter substrate-binding protein [Gloeocapsa sp. PCC 73106]ELR98694.1 ABC-type phosphate transport system, periplasmic component [Gloeocapsa sp. PCC 73106]